jgi:hypothetical protein
MGRGMSFGCEKLRLILWRRTKMESHMVLSIENGKRFLMADHVHFLLMANDLGYRQERREIVRRTEMGLRRLRTGFAQAPQNHGAEPQVQHGKGIRKELRRVRRIGESRAVGKCERDLNV